MVTYTCFVKRTAVAIDFGGVLVSLTLYFCALFVNSS